MATWRRQQPLEDMDTVKSSVENGVTRQIKQTKMTTTTASKKTTQTSTIQQQSTKYSSTAVRTSSMTTSFDESDSMVTQQQQHETNCADSQKIVDNGVAEAIVTSTMTKEVTSTKKSKKKLSDAAGKKKLKKSKKSDAEKENISVKSSFDKFDNLQKKNILHVRSSDAGRAQEKFNDGKVETEKNCRACGKIVYKMEEMKAERNTWHKNCFRCNECGKQLNVDSYQSHESVVYCKPHFRLLFAPKAVEDNEPVKPRKPEMIIRENEPAILPPDVVRASDKPDLGLEDLQQLNVRERFQVFEHYKENSNEERTQQIRDRSPTGVKRSTSILSKLAKFQAKGMNTGLNDESLSGVQYEDSSEEEEDDIDENDQDADLIRAKRAQRERPMSFRNMSDIKSKFENGHVMSREERREETKQEIQNIRSRLFMGKQARIKEMYQQAVADSEQAIISADKKPEIEIGDKARSLKEKFEKGEIFNENKNETDQQKLHDEEMEVFEQGISKMSRSIFQNLDATQQQQALLPNQSPKSPDARRQQQPFSGTGDVVKSTDKSEDIKIETSEISSKFKFFEQYRPTEKERKPFSITPPRQGVVKSESPEPDKNGDPTNLESEGGVDDQNIAAKSHTATKMLSMFRQLEESKNSHAELELKPLKRFTPPPDGNRRVYNDESDEDGDEEDEEEYEEEEGEEEAESEEETAQRKYNDEFLRQAQSAARAKQLCAKFEKWEANEIKREMNNNSSVNLYENFQENDEGQVESAKSLREKFEALRETTNMSANRPRVQVNRFL